jgi:L-ascorbate metabolism protein UlaG (beta-lactamase superfamily)
LASPARSSDHFDGRRFFNPEGPPTRALIDVLRWKLTSRAASSPDFVDDNFTPEISGSPAAGETRITLVNHSTLLIQSAGRTILTDPVWSLRVSPFSRLGPRRHRAPGVAFSDLPKIDLLLISHNHYDHLDAVTLRQVASRHAPRVLVPLGLRPLMQELGFRYIQELDWWQEADSIISVPALHFSARGLFDRNRTLWCGYAFHTAAGLVYFAADTAFGGHFQQIRQRLGPPRVALLPIGAYEPRWFMNAVHMSPAEALEAHRILEARESIAIHQGTFQLADESIDQPRIELAQYQRGEVFRVPRNGETFRLTPVTD